MCISWLVDRFRKALLMVDRFSNLACEICQESTGFGCLQTIFRKAPNFKIRFSGLPYFKIWFRRVPNLIVKHRISKSGRSLNRISKFITLLK